MVAVRRLCALHAVSRSCYLGQQTRTSVKPDLELTKEIEAIALKWTGYGYRRVTHELARRGRPTNHKRVLRVMRAGGLLCRPKRRVQATTDSAHSERRFENLLPTVVPTQPNQVWQVDLTSVRVNQRCVGRTPCSGLGAMNLWRFCRTPGPRAARE
ncbi:IS3 family transposase [Deinococcus oregonensis]|uniref:IS3 family transposase n=1 Tax=Deinococcus oregonensis TaxID=1805970 RepID=A0ABV6B8K4_9DEIO